LAKTNVKRLDALEEDRRKHEELIKVLTSHMNNFDTEWRPLTEEGVEKLVQKLYSLKHFGKNLRSVKQAIAAAHEATYREIPFRVNGPGTQGSYRLCQRITVASQPSNKSNSDGIPMTMVVRPKSPTVPGPPSRMLQNLLTKYRGRLL
jgi:hypothetical protein